MIDTDLINYIIHLADNALILAQRNSEWTGMGPALEQDIAMSNISLDLIGQARMFYQYAASLLDDGSTEDSLAYLRDAWDFKNQLLVELERGDWAKTVLRQFFFSTYQYGLFEKLQKSADPGLAAIAQKSLKEVSYHLRWSAEWVVRLGDGTQESHSRMVKALKDLWPYTGELTTHATYELVLAEKGIGISASAIKDFWVHKIQDVFQEACLLPDLEAEMASSWMHLGGKQGRHTEHLGYLLAEMQFLQRAYPGCEW